VKRAVTQIKRHLDPRRLSPHPRWLSPDGHWLRAGTRLVVISSLLVTGALSALRATGVLQSAELYLFDAATRTLPDQPPHPDMTVVSITEEDVQQYGWPLSDRLLALTITKLQAHTPAVIGLDLYRSSPRPPGNQDLVQAMAADNLIAIMNVGGNMPQGDVPPPPTVPWDRVGFNDLPVDRDGAIRRTLVYVKSSPDGYYSFGLRVVMAFLGPQGALTIDENQLRLGDAELERLPPFAGGYATVDNRGYQILSRYHSRAVPAAEISISQVLSDQFDPADVQGKIVLIGTTAPSLKDYFFTPYSSGHSSDRTMAGVVIHAQIISHLLNLATGEMRPYRFLLPAGEWLWLLGWCLAAGSLAWGVRQPGWLLFLGGGMVIVVMAIGWAGITQMIWLPMAEPALGVVATGIAVMAYKLLYRSTHDALTGLPNRDAFLGSIEGALKKATAKPDGAATAPHALEEAIPAPVIVVFMDINRFKVINESLGHHAGDQVLQLMAERLKQHMPPTARLARVGGDEFALLLTGYDVGAAGQHMDQLQMAISTPLQLNGQKLSSTVSMGMAISQARLGYKPADLLRDAHTAMYRAKALGKARYEIFAAGMLTEAVNRLQLESDLISALENEEFLLYYQPIVSLATGKLAGFEALVRWCQADRGFVLPSAFIPAAEETGLIMPLGRWIFHEACQQLKTWQQQFPQHGHLTMSINLSNRQFGQADLIAQIEAALSATQVRGNCIRLEITESMVMGDVDGAIDLMLRLKALNLKLGLDDFGTGYSSLSYLHRFPMDTLKVDKSFVSGLQENNEDRAIIHTILTLGKNLGMEVVAEGVETKAQVEILQQERCNYGQGYYFAKPLSSADATALLANPQLDL